jgi:hypothetical protein
MRRREYLMIVCPLARDELYQIYYGIFYFDAEHFEFY